MGTATFINTGVTGQCPPQGLYTLELVGHGDITVQPKYQKPNETERRIDISFKIVGVPDDIEDFEFTEEEEMYLEGRSRTDYWMGYELKDFYNVDVKDWNNEKCKLGLLWKALANKKTIEVGESFDIDSYFGTRIKSQLAPKENGWPKIMSYMPAPQKRAASPTRTPRPVATSRTVTTEAHGDDEEFPE